MPFNQLEVSQTTPQFVEIRRLNDPNKPITSLLTETVINKPLMDYLGIDPEAEASSSLRKGMANIFKNLLPEDCLSLYQKIFEHYNLWVANGYKKITDEYSLGVFQLYSSKGPVRKE